MEQQNIILEGIHYSSGKVVRLGIRNGYIFSLSEPDRSHDPGGEDREPVPVIAPGLIDLQINGYKGIDFNDPELTVEQVGSVAKGLLAIGVTRFYPTLITGPRKRTSTLIRTILQAVSEKGPASHSIGGIHLEGPFISKEDGPRGAHPKRYCLDPDPSLVQKWQDEAEGRIRIITLAPELPGSETLIRSCVEMGMVVAIGHTGANSDQIRRAVEAGATLSTHLGNGSHNILPRHPNYIWDQLAREELYASMIADGFHLPDAVLRVFMLSKKQKAILVSDGMPCTGLEPGLYKSPAAGRIRLTGSGKLHREGNPDLLAGSASRLVDGVRKISVMEGFATAWDMGSTYPARLMGLGSGHGLQVGAPADMVLLDSNLVKLKMIRVYKNGVGMDVG